ncbi:hypothetical protein F5884DRAFT_829156 [Xylogone sp. PMI_703]|nr:hypothetical protein F5884DRAFT_829156 [Xylogone sp. PMI_703]
MNGTPTSTDSPRRSSVGGLGGSRTKGEMNSVNFRTRERQLAAIRKNWNVQDDLWAPFPAQIRPQDGYIGGSAVAILKRISDTVNLQEAQRLITGEFISGEGHTRIGYAGLCRIWDRLKNAGPGSTQPNPGPDSLGASSQNGMNREHSITPAGSTNQKLAPKNEPTSSKSAPFIAPIPNMVAGSSLLNSPQKLQHKSSVPSNLSDSGTTKSGFADGSLRPSKSNIPVNRKEQNKSSNNNSLNDSASKKRKSTAAAELSGENDTIIRPEKKQKSEVQKSKGSQDTQPNKDNVTMDKAKNSSQGGNSIIDSPGTTSSMAPESFLVSPHDAKATRLQAIMEHNRRENSKFFNPDRVMDDVEETITVDYPSKKRPKVSQDTIDEDVIQNGAPKEAVKAIDKITDNPKQHKPRNDELLASTPTSHKDGQVSAQHSILKLTTEEFASATAEYETVKKEVEILSRLHKLEKFLFTQDKKSDDKMKHISEFVTKLESYVYVDISILNPTKIKQVLHAITNVDDIPKGEDAHLRARCQALIDEWSKFPSDEHTPIIPSSTTTSKLKGMESTRDEITKPSKLEPKNVAEKKSISVKAAENPRSLPKSLDKKTKGAQNRGGITPKKIANPSFIAKEEAKTKNNNADSSSLVHKPKGSEKAQMLDDKLEQWCKSLPSRFSECLDFEELQKVVHKDQLSTIKELKRTIDKHVNRIQVDMQWIIDKASMS